jgi:predicted nucleic acid-binding protein
VIVTDASVVLELLLRTTAADAVETRLFNRGETLHAPHLLDVEVAQVLRRYAGRGEISAARGRLTLGLLVRLPIERYAHEPLLARIWALRANLTAYDAAYVALAEALGATLLTRDERLAAAPGSRATIELV